MRESNKKEKKIYFRALNIEENRIINREKTRKIKINIL